MNILELLYQGSQKLKARNINSHQLDSEILLSKVLKKDREEILIRLNRKLDQNEISKFNSFISRRSFYEPIAYILEEKEFWSKIFFVNHATLIPRPETELMVERLVKIYKSKAINILDAGIGSGCILISLLAELKKSKGTGIDVSQSALLVAKKNVKRHKMEDKIRLYKKPFSELYNCKYDLLVSNPPYIMTKDLRNLDEDIRKFEPKKALDGGNDGLDLIKKVIYKASEILKVNGRLALEIGNEQFDKVSKLLLKRNFKTEHKIKDYKDNIRCIISKKTS